MDKDETSIRDSDNLFSRKCSGIEDDLHDLVEFDMKITKDRKYRIGTCPSCNRTYISKISGQGWESMKW